ncbi:MAG: putative DNA-directed DNA polymerase [Prokaryotic dsDNA virus sp.]|nr:MAG: putative DNA-directed DNA polymerase [Prokaryotic dsDNA virus sp.]|tara:strand:- start:14682 stop:15455 length:774 start_codon:yes stop_codon:yes gene_type:complete
MSLRNAVQVIFDIETVRGKNFIGNEQSGVPMKTIEDCEDAFEKAWFKHGERKYKDMNVEDSFEKGAGLVPEFGMIVCIVAMDSISKIPVRFKMIIEDGEPDFDAIEKGMLLNFYMWLDELEEESKNPVQLIGHYIKKFDVPYVNTRSAKHGLKIHSAFKCYGIKPWDLIMIDTKEVWNGGIFGTSQASSLDNVCRILGIESPKNGGEDELDGSMVGEEFWNGKGKMSERVKRICDYCERDVIANAKVLNKMFSLNMI